MVLRGPCVGWRGQQLGRGPWPVDSAALARDPALPFERFLLQNHAEPCGSAQVMNSHVSEAVEELTSLAHTCRKSLDFDGAERHLRGIYALLKVTHCPTFRDVLTSQVPPSGSITMYLHKQPVSQIPSVFHATFVSEQHRRTLHNNLQSLPGYHVLNSCILCSGECGRGRALRHGM